MILKQRPLTALLTFTGGSVLIRRSYSGLANTGQSRPLCCAGGWGGISWLLLALRLARQLARWGGSGSLCATPAFHVPRVGEQTENLPLPAAFEPALSQNAPCLWMENTTVQIPPDKLSNFNVSASAQPRFKLLTVSHSPPTKAEADSRGAKRFGPIGGADVGAPQCHVTRLVEWINVPANEDVPSRHVIKPCGQVLCSLLCTNRNIKQLGGSDSKNKRQPH